MYEVTDEQQEKLMVVRELEKSGKDDEAVKLYVSLGDDGVLWCYSLAASKFDFGGHNVDRNPGLALRYYKLALDSEERIDAIHSIARLYSTEGSIDLGKAFTFYKKLSKIDDPLSQIGHYRIGVLYYHGFKERRADKDKAICHWQIAANMGHAWALRNVAIQKYRDGKIVQAAVLAIRSIFLALKYCVFDPTNPSIRRL